MAEKQSSRKENRGSTLSPIQGKFRIVDLKADLQASKDATEQGQLYYVTVNNNVAGLTITGISFQVWYCAPVDCYGPRTERYDGVECATGYYIEFPFYTPSSGDCPSRIEKVAFSVKGDGGTAGKYQAKGTLGQCQPGNEFILWLSDSLGRE